jgi:hypothetical protein
MMAFFSPTKRGSHPIELLGEKMNAYSGTRWLVDNNIISPVTEKDDRQSTLLLPFSFFATKLVSFFASSSCLRESPLR